MKSANISLMIHSFDVDFFDGDLFLRLLGFILA